MPVLWIATNNPKKRRELQRLLDPLGFDLRLQAEAPSVPAVDENAPDFAGNAALKAIALARAVGAPAIGDDSGLCVDALGGQPGVRSARFAGVDASDADRVAKLLDLLRAVPAVRRTARFVCHICLAGGDGRVLARFEASCPGRIIAAPRGTAGFGYDPIFAPDAQPRPPHELTFAELADEQKDAISHRGQALRRLAEYLRCYPLT